MKSFRPTLSMDQRKKQKSFGSTIVRESNNKVEHLTKNRSVRSDKKKDIKIPVSPEQKRKLMLLARTESIKRQTYVSITEMTSQLIEKGLFEYEYFPKIEYESSHEVVRAKLSSFYVTQLFNFQLEWTANIRQSAARILYYMLEIENDEEIQ